MERTGGRAFAVLAALLLTAGIVRAQTDTASPVTPRQILPTRELVEALRRGGFVIHVRHAATEKGQVLPKIEDPADCTTQRQLSELGRTQARQMGAAFRALAIPVGAIRSSPYCRCVDTLREAFGRVEVSPDLASSIPVGEPEARRLARALHAMLATPPAAGTNTVLAGHMSNLKEATGIWPEPEGVAHVFQPLPDGGLRLVGEIPPDRWSALAKEQ